jgi:glutathione S-transferase
MILYHFTTSPFARRVRLVLAHKGLGAELRDARANPEHASELRRLNPVHTVPVLVDGDRVVTDSAAICQYLDRKIPEPPLWPSGIDGAAALELVTIADGVIRTLADLGMRYAAFHDHPSFAEVRDVYVAGRVQRSLDRLAKEASERMDAAGLVGDRWSGADIAVCTLAMWLDGLAARAATFPPAGKVVALGWRLPEELRAWTAARKARPDVQALDG